MIRLRSLVIVLAATVTVVSTSAPSAEALGAPVGTVIQISGGALVPVYPVSGGGSVTAIGFRHVGTQLTAYDQTGSTLWVKTVTGDGPFGGGDFDHDGWPDVFFQVLTSTGTICGGNPAATIYNSSLDFYSGHTGSKTMPTAPMADRCWTFPGTPAYVTHQWASDTVHWGPTAISDKFAVSPYYANPAAWYFYPTGGAYATYSAMYYPSTSSYDNTYTADLTDAHAGATTSYSTDPHVANGLITTVGGQPRYVFWTSGRVVQYAIGPLNSGQLISDCPFLTGFVGTVAATNCLGPAAGRTDIVGRNYGLVGTDPVQPSRIAMLGGTSNDSLYLDMKNHAPAGSAGATDQFGGIERHVSLFDAAANTMQDKYYSYAHDNNDGDKYQGRVSFPANPWVLTGGASSRLAYNVYSDGHWYLHITKPGSLVDDYALPDAFLWDITDTDGDGVQDWLISPTRYASDPNVPGYYETKYVTNWEHWTESTLTLTAYKATNGIPELGDFLLADTVTDSSGVRHPAQVIQQGGQGKVVFLDAAGNTFFG